MKASQAIKQIQELIDQHGDIDIVLYQDEFGFFYPAEKLILVNDKKKWPIDDSWQNPIKLPVIVVTG